MDETAATCPSCGASQQQQQANSQPIIVNVENHNTNNNSGRHGTEKNKWIALALCLTTGVIGGHKFYEGKIGSGILYLLTGGLLGIGVIVNTIGYIFKPNPYYV